MKKYLLIGAAVLFGFIAVTAAVASDHKPTRHAGRHATCPAVTASHGAKIHKDSSSRRHIPAARKHAGRAVQIHQAR